MERNSDEVDCSGVMGGALTSGYGIVGGANGCTVNSLEKDIQVIELRIKMNYNALLMLLSHLA